MEVVDRGYLKDGIQPPNTLKPQNRLDSADSPSSAVVFYCGEPVTTTLMSLRLRK